MAPLASFLIPWRPDGGRRDDLWSAARFRLEQHFPDCELIVQDDRGDEPDLFNHGQAVNLAAARATTDVLVIADADTVPIDSLMLHEAIFATSQDRRWRLPHRYAQLTEKATDHVLDRMLRDPIPVDLADVEWVADRVSWSGIVIVPREAFELVDGCDERYHGWGADDVALGLALDTLYDAHERYPSAALHLAHPRGEQERGDHRYGDEQRSLTSRYQKAAGSPPKMRVLIPGRRLP